MGLQVDRISGADSTKTVAVIFDDTNGGIAIDYSEYFERIATAAETIANNSTQVANALNTDSTPLSQIVTSIADSLGQMYTLASTTGIRTQGALDWIGLVSTYKLYVDDEGAIGLEALTEYKEKIDNLPKSF